MTKKYGVLITNTGTPDAPTTTAVRKYLREFLSDKRIVQLPRLIWLPILYGLILPTRPRKSAELYQTIWTEDGSPLRVIMQKIRSALMDTMSVPVEIGMNYGNPSIKEGLQKLRQQEVDEIIILPLFPQHSHTTTASTFDRVTAAVAKQPLLIHSYADHPLYIQALAASVQHFWKKQNAPRHLLISFHGIPQSFVKGGDPYQTQCELTSRLIANALNLPKDKWTLCYQSQFGYAKWLKPSTFDLLTEFPKQGIQDVDIICPGFAVDCLETLEEIAIRSNEMFIRAGGRSLRYIPALNDSDEHIKLLANLALSMM
jgi:ferrochelatase